MHAIPLELKKAIAIGIGLFIAFIGLYNSGRSSSAAPGTAGRRSAASRPGRSSSTSSGSSSRSSSAHAASAATCSSGSSLTTVVRDDRQRGDRLRRRLHAPGAAWPGDIVSQRRTSRCSANSDFDAFATLGVVSALVWVFALFLSDFFDTMGTLVGVGKPAGLPGQGRRLPRDPQAAARRLARGDGRRGGVLVVRDDLHRVGCRRRRQAAARAGSRVVCGRAVLPVPVPRAADRDGAAAGDGGRADHRRLADDQLAHRGRGRSRRGRDRRTAA